MKSYLIVDTLTQPIQQTINRLGHIRQLKMENDNELIFQGLLVLAVSSFEQCISDILRVLLKSFPEKLSVKLSKNDYISNDPIKIAIENELRSKAYGNIEEFFKYFSKHLGISDFTACEDFEKLKEIKETRNLLLHNDLIINNDYKYKAGSFQRTGTNNKLSIDDDYLYNSLKTTKDFLTTIEDEIKKEYSHFTPSKAFEEIWKEVFTTPVMPFDEFWDITDNGKIQFKNYDFNPSILSGGEKFTFDFLITHLEILINCYTSGAQEKSRLTLISISPKDKLKLIIDNIELLREAIY